MRRNIAPDTAVSFWSPHLHYIALESLGGLCSNMTQTFVLERPEQTTGSHTLFKLDCFTGPFNGKYQDEPS